MVTEAYKNITADTGTLFMLRQVLTILGLFAAGFIPLRLLRERIDTVWVLLLSFPIGLSIYSVAGFLLLVCGVGFGIPGILILYVLLIVAAFLLRNKQGEKGQYDIALTVGGSVTVAVLSVVACSGLLSQYVTNDSVYYYSMYPSILVKDGFLSPALDKFLTDVGQTTAVIQSLPFMLGYDETFGIQHFFNFNFVLIFFRALFDSTEILKDKKGLRIVLSAAGTLFLVTSEPFIVISKWVLSNVYFMDILFILVLISLKAAKDERISRDYVFLIIILTSKLTMCRMEGGVMVFVIALTLSVLPFGKRDMLILYGLPLALMELSYYGTIYLKIGVDPLYSFLSIKTVLMMAGLIFLYFVYIIFVRERLDKGIVLLLLFIALLAGNLGLLAINHSRYIADIRAFILNIRLGNGWGIFVIVMAIYAVLFLAELIKLKGRDLSPELFLPAALVLTIFAVCFARGGVLAVRTSDSGNRVLMEIVPLLTFAVYSRIINMGKGET